MDEVVAASPQPEAAWDMCVEQLLGDAGDKYTVNAAGTLGAAMRDLYVDMQKGPDDAANVMVVHAMSTVAKVSGSKTVVRFRAHKGAELGEYTTPANERDVRNAPDCAEWMRAAHDAFWVSIVNLPNNRIVPAQPAYDAGLDVGDLTTVYKYKVEDEVLDKRKVRHSVDEARQMRKTRDPAKRDAIKSYLAFTMPVGELEANCFWATVSPDDYVIVIDWPDAYGTGQCGREPRLVRPPPMLDVRTETGEPALLELGGPLWGEGAAGNEFEATRNEDMNDAAWPNFLDIPAAFYHGNSGRAISIIDDLAARDKGGYDELNKLCCFLSERSVARGVGKIKVRKAPELWGGMKIERSADFMTLTLSMPEHIEAVTLVWLPELVKENKLRPDVPTGKKLRNALDALVLQTGIGPLNKEQRDFQSVVGNLRWFVRRVTRILKPCHHLSRVAARAPPDAMLSALGVLAEAFEHRHEGQTYGGDCVEPTIMGALKGSVDVVRKRSIAKVDGDALLANGAGKVLGGGSDTSWNAGADGQKDLLALALTLNGASVSVQLKSVPATGSSAECEGLGILKLSDTSVYGRVVARAFGANCDAPTLLLCDAEAALRAASGQQTTARLKHTLRRAAIVQARIRESEIALAHIPDATNFVDFLTKWVPKEKVEASLAYLNGTVNRAAHGVATAAVLTSVAKMTSVHAALAIVGAWCCCGGADDDEADDAGSWS